MKIITIPIEKKLESECNLKKHSCYGKGASRLGNREKVETISESFYYIGSVDIDQARQLLVRSMEEVMRKINENEEIRPYLSHFPIAPKNLSFGVHINSKEELSIHDDTRVPVNQICHFCAVNGKLSYFVRLYVTYPDEPDSKLVLEETYEEALQKLQTPRP